ncbi:2-oxoglutarate-dependent dioxygenase 19 isoform X1 [Ziziphus jujuba]|uniref:2-oxoglutarate-dependent dioxygenase 19 isoform X1 n=1 Tax=Ziziphus jujuba TaxID=326968 RepID=A0A6P3ZN39_ZIZJJ|nr:2-oxoglutarate-dependent dioxygenase 19 isoform X1 [Ziziphus jujuba]
MEVPTVSLVIPPSNSIPAEPPKIISAKMLAESASLTSAIPSAYYFSEDSYELADPNDPEFQLPTIDFSLLTSDSPDQRSKMLHELANICRDWGCFLVTNHGVTESLKQAMIEAADRFFNLTEEEKHNIAKKYEADPTQIRYGTSYNARSEKVRLWRDFIKLRLHPDFPTLNENDGYSEVAMKYSKKTREIATELVEAISESLGLDPNYIYKALDLDSGVQFLLANYYPPCPQPELAMGLSHHTDQCLITILTDNDVSGLQVLHNHKWVTVTSTPKTFLVILADQMQIVTNGKYKSAMHRGRVNKEAKRISLASLHGPSFETLVTPSPVLVEREGKAPLYRSIKYREYVELQHRSRMDLKCALDQILI